MGANEKYEEAMHGFTPDTNQIRNCYGQRWYEQTERQSDAEFNRWLTQIRAEAKAEALNEAADELDKSKQPLRHGLPMMLRADWLRARAEQYKEQL